jgi:signal transduction histidine kinase
MFSGMVGQTWPAVGQALGVSQPVPPLKGHIGLALVREAAADLGGSLQVRNDGGTVVTITLPPG